MEGYLDYKKNPKEYVYTKVYESLIEARLALEMLKRGLLKNAFASFSFC
ncbi:hypothetical protein HNQ62_002375 [Sulfurisphaera ohwakuensis]|uniref:Uncharacterized protein n=1 Tax=Sulfurisphaera ohwakuensis TaxID=69656 RepID=A0A7J9RUV0_SULOH|nr:hypothetical protein [Sulfurisphaera ohwakuensis]